jgi:predicted DNA-binding protein (UPF0251 family)
VTAVQKLFGLQPAKAEKPVEIPLSRKEIEKVNNIVPTGRIAKEQDAARKAELNQAKLHAGLESASQKVSQALTDGASKLAAAFEKLRSAKISAYDLLPDRQQNQLRDQASSRINASIRKGQLSRAKVEEMLGTGYFEDAYPKDLFDVESKATAINSANQEIQNTLVESNTNLQNAIDELALKQWAVNVKVAGGKATAEGDVLGGVE